MGIYFLTLARQHPVFPGGNQEATVPVRKKEMLLLLRQRFFLLRFYDMCDKLVPSIFCE